MDKKNELIKIIQDANVADDFKAELISLVEADENFGPDTIKKVREKITEHAYDAIDEITDLEMEDALVDFNREIDQLDKDINQFETDINQKADEIDANALRDKIT